MIAAIVEGTTRSTLVIHQSDDKSADSKTSGMMKSLRHLLERTHLSLIWDHGMEVTWLTRPSTQLQMPVLLCDPASPQQADPMEH